MKKDLEELIKDKENIIKEKDREIIRREEEIKNIKKSFSYKLSRVLLSPLRILYHLKLKVSGYFLRTINHFRVRKFELNNTMLKDNIDEYSIELTNKSQKIGFATVLNEDFIVGFEVLIFSIIKHNPSFSYDFFIIHDQSLKIDSIKKIKSIYEKINFIKVDLEQYKNIRVNKRLGVEPYYNIECFNIKGFDKIVYLDCDTLCKGSLKELIETNCDFGICYDIGSGIIPRKLKGSENYILNSGMLVIGKKYLNQKTYKELLRIANNNQKHEDDSINVFCDQRVLNIYFADKKIHYFSLSYNASKRLYRYYRKFSISKVVLLHYVGIKPWDKSNAEKKYKELNELWDTYYQNKIKVDQYLNSNEIKKLKTLNNKYKGKRCFIIGNGPSLKGQDLKQLKNEYTFVTNWFALHEEYKKIDPDFYCICSHTVFGGWNVDKPKIDENLYKLLFNKTKNSIKFFSYKFKDYIEENNFFEGHKIYYLLYDSKLKKFIERKGSFNLDILKPLDDGHSAVITFCMFLANLMGFKEIYLLGCDCDYGIKKSTDEKKYFYKSKLHTSKTSSFEHLKKVYSDNGPIFESYKIAYNALKKNNVKVYNATEGGRLEIIPRINYKDIFKSN